VRCEPRQAEAHAREDRCCDRAFERDPRWDVHAAAEDEPPIAVAQVVGIDQAVRTERTEGADMTVRVDELKRWPTKIRCFVAGSAHLTADTLEELHAFAARIGLRREWFQDHPIAPHYDLSIKRHAAALAAGAEFVPARAQARARILARVWKDSAT